MHRARDYANKDYWQSRFQEEDEFEWLHAPDGMIPILDFFIQRSVGQSSSPSAGERHPRILVLGCGNSGLSAALHDTGAKEVVSMDFSDVVLERMRERYHHRPDMQWVQCDALDMNCFEEGSFDAVIDKCTLDAISCGGVEAVGKATREVHRVLAPARGVPALENAAWGGVYCLVTYSRFRVDDFLEEEASYAARDLSSAVAASRLDVTDEQGNVDLAAVQQAFLPPGSAQDRLWQLACCIPVFSEEEHDNGSVALPSNAHYLLVFTAKK
mmetsp:Transcript_16158/g.63009  ORF Transcript_16158/g.63009 Transcript_16158/m.63009 type:complete len:270 (+) Transcript_16158:70-879(+)